MQMCHIIVGRAVREISILIRKYFQRFHRNWERIEVGQEEVGVVDEDLVVQLRRVIESEEERPRQKPNFTIGFKTHPKLVNAQNKHEIDHFGGMGIEKFLALKYLST